MVFVPTLGWLLTHVSSPVCRCLSMVCSGMLELPGASSWASWRWLFVGCANGVLVGDQKAEEGEKLLASASNGVAVAGGCWQQVQVKRDWGFRAPATQAQAASFWGSRTNSNCPSIMCLSRRWRKGHNQGR